MRESPSAAGGATPPALQPGAAFGAYRIVRRLGRGGMGEVFLACDERLGRQVAIKRVRGDRPPSAAERQRFRREARAAARLNHPAIVQIFDLVEDETGDAIVMEHVEGITLAELLARGPCSLALALRLGRDVALGLAAAHAAGLVHRDLKTDNVMLGPSGEVKILDFGLARPLQPEREGEEALTAQGLVLGTFHTMSPEQARGAALDGRSDLFSLGVLLYELLTGRSPFRGASRLDTLDRILRHHPPPVDRLRSGLPAALAPLVERCLAKEPTRRPASAGEVARALDAIALRAGAAGASAAVAVDADRADAAAAGNGADAPRAAGSAHDATTAAPAVEANLAGDDGRAPAHRMLARRHRAAPRRRLPAAAAGLAAILAAGGGLWLLTRPSLPLRIAVLRPAVGPPRDPALDLAAAAVVAASLGELGARRGLAAVAPGEAGTASSSPALAARGAAAQEVLTFQLQREGGMGRLSLVRAQGGDGRVLWSDTFAVPVDPSELGELAAAVAAHLERAYAEHPRRPGAPRLDVRDADYADFVRLSLWLDTLLAGEMPPALPAPDLARLEALPRQAPRFLDGLLLASQVWEELRQATADPRDGRRACDLARRAGALAPEDPRPLDRLARAALAAGLTGEAAAAAAELARRAPGDAAVPELRSRLAEARGESGPALAEMRRAAARLPSWRNVARLAGLEARHGELAAARARFAELLARTPGNPAAQLAQAEMELDSGDPARAEALLAGLARRAREAAGLAALCRARSLLGRPAAALTACREALAVAPAQVFVGLDLADALRALGRRQEADEEAATVLAALRRGDGSSPGGPLQRLAEARCLASLGRGEEAVALAQQTLQGAAASSAGAPLDPRLAYQAALVYALSGDRGSALDSMRQALAGGVPRRLFAAFGFRTLAAEPELRALAVAAAAPAVPPAPQSPPAAQSGSHR